MDEKLSNLFRELARKHRFVVQKYLDQFDLYIGQPNLLFSIGDNPGITQKELGLCVKMSKETLSVSLNRLEHSGFIQRKTTEQDRRQKQLYLTAEGKHVVAQCKSGFESINQAMFSTLTDLEKRELETLFSLMIEGLKERSLDEEIV